MPLVQTFANASSRGWGTFLPSGSINSYELISTTLVGSTATSVVFTSGAWSTYKHLQLRITARSTQGTSNDSVGLRFNTDSGSNYSEHVLYGNASNVLSASGTSASFMSAMTMAADGATYQIYGAGIVDILDFGSTTKNKTIKSLSANPGWPFIQLRSGSWMSTAAVTSITLFSANGATGFLPGSRFSLYGLKG